MYTCSSGIDDDDNLISVFESPLSLVILTGSVASMVARLGDCLCVKNRCVASPGAAVVVGFGRTSIRRRSATRPCRSNLVSERDIGRRDFTDYIDHGIVI